MQIFFFKLCQSSQPLSPRLLMLIQNSLLRIFYFFFLQRNRIFRYGYRLFRIKKMKFSYLHAYLFMQLFYCTFYIRFTLKYDGPDAIGPLNDIILFQFQIDIIYCPFIVHLSAKFISNITIKGLGVF